MTKLPSQLELLGTLLGIACIPCVAVKTFHFLKAECTVTLPTRKCVKPYLPLTTSAAEVIEINCVTQTRSMAVRGWLSAVVALLSATFGIAHGEYRVPTTQDSCAVPPLCICLHFLFLLTLNSWWEEPRQAEVWKLSFCIFRRKWQTCTEYMTELKNSAVTRKALGQCRPLPNNSFLHLWLTPKTAIRSITKM